MKLETMASKNERSLFNNFEDEFKVKNSRCLTCPTTALGLKARSLGPADLEESICVPSDSSHPQIFTQAQPY